jgi:hypothetical protein
VSLAGSDTVQEEHIAVAARLVLAPRATRLPAATAQPDAEPPQEPASAPESAQAVPTATILIDPGNASSYSGSGNTVTSVGSNTISGTMSNVTYNSGNGGKFQFNGSSSSISFGSFDFTNNFTIIAWVKPVSSNTINTVISNTSAGLSTNGFKAYWNSWQTTDRKLLVEDGNGSSGGASVTDNAVVTYGAWQQLTWVVNRSTGTATYYLNGVAQSATTSSVRTDFATSATWWIGSIAGGSYWMNADLGLLKVYTSILTQSDVATEYSATQSRYAIPVSPTISTNPSNSSAPSGNTATFTGAATTTDSGTISYQWQVSTDTGTTWNNVASGTGGTTGTYTTPATSISMSGYQYRLVATNTLSGNAATTNSNVATLTVTKATPTVTTSLPFGSTTSATYRSNIAITLNSSAPGKIGLKANGKWIPACRSLSISTSVICNFKPSNHGVISITAVFIPTSTSNYFGVTTQPAFIASIPRSNSR